MSKLAEQVELEVKKILDSDMTSYEMSKLTGVTITALDKYRSGKSLVENMTFKTAKKLLELKNINDGKKLSNNMKQ